MSTLRRVPLPICPFLFGFLIYLKPSGQIFLLILFADKSKYDFLRGHKGLKPTLKAEKNCLSISAQSVLSKCNYFLV